MKMFSRVCDNVKCIDSVLHDSWVEMESLQRKLFSLCIIISEKLVW